MSFERSSLVTEESRVDEHGSDLPVEIGSVHLRGGSAVARAGRYVLTGLITKRLGFARDSYPPRTPTMYTGVTFVTERSPHGPESP